MTHDFPHILLSLRKERKLTQKQAAKDLDISPALLSHYEKGIRECGLQFVVRAADYYHVSCDYLLGRTTDRSGMAPELVSPQGVHRHHDKPLELSSPVDQRQKQVLQAIHILFQMMESCEHDRLTQEAYHALSVLIYSLFRELCGRHPKTSRSMFTLSSHQIPLLATAAVSRSVARVSRLVQGRALQEDAGVSADKIPALSQELLRRDFPFFMSSLTHLFRDAESTIKDVQ